MRNSTLRVLSVWLLVLSIWAMPTICGAVAGTEYQSQEEDFVVAVDSRWAGCRSGGYHPIRVRIQNRADTRDVTVVFRPVDRSLPSVSRTVNCPQNATTLITLLVPMIGSASSGELEFFGPRGRLRDLGRNINVSEQDLNSVRAGLLVISPTNEDCTQFEHAVSSTFNAGGGHYGTANTENHFVVQPVMLPNTAISYSGLDIVAVPLKTLQSLPSETREAILNWTQTGGNLLVYEVGENGYENADLRKLVGTDRTTVVADWKKCDPSRRHQIPVRQFDQYGNETVVGGNVEAELKWAAAEQTFAVRSYGLGHLIVFAANPFPGSPHDWAWLFDSARMTEIGRWANRLGANPRNESADFYQFLIPGIQSVPVYSFLFFITLFAVVIGPINYFVLARRNQLNALIITVPALALLTSLALFVFSAVSHGFSVKGRTRSLTVIDQGMQSSVVMSRLSLYAGMTPSNGLKFSPETVVIPLWPREVEFEGGSVDWTQTQHLTNGFLRARTKTQYHTLLAQAERGRLTVESPSNDVIRITNGLEWELDLLVVGDDAGKLYFGRNVAAGTPATLKALTDEDRIKVLEDITSNMPAVPDEYNNNSNFGMFSNMGASRRYRYGYYGGVQPSVRLQDGLMERKLKDVRTTLEARSPMRRSYFATMKKYPKLETGTQVDVVQEWHALLGSY